MKAVWTQLSLSQPPDLPGHAAYAKKQAAMHARMESEAEKRLDGAGYRDLRLKATNDYGALIEYVTVLREEEEAVLKSGAH
jgi:hypothetical protein